MEKIRVLIVDDNPIYLRVMQSCLQRVGDYDITLADGGAACLEKLQSEAFGLILLDIQMPDIDGYEILSKIREKRIETRVIVTSSLEGVAARAKVIRAGAADFLAKPVTPEVLKIAIARAFHLDTTIGSKSAFSTQDELEQLEREIEILRKNNTALKKQIYELSSQPAHRNPVWVSFFPKIASIVIAIFAAWALYKYAASTKGQAIAVFFAIAAILILPIERVSRVKAAYGKNEASVEADPMPISSRNTD